MASVSRAALVFLLLGLLVVQHAQCQITFSKNWQPGKRGEMCSQREAQAVIKLRQVLLEEAKLVAECRMFYASDGAPEE
ncbi:uncharacterized protein LOC115312557 [Ixodes scapularis]|uniref:uncharacterized protein LOC115312557 n=1 Tax=Ixodes scapularis TaxID=6945 RepID=UPI001AD60F89|nr:uncharacterized protein LOC115312557 [Ixodes scapularis]